MYAESTLTVIYTYGREEPTSPTPSKKWAAKFTIENMEFTTELATNSSKQFKKLANDLEDLLNDIFNQMSGFLYVKVISFEKGSIICNFFIYMKVESSATTKEFESILSAAAKSGKTGKFKITNIAVSKDQEDSVGAVKGKKPKDEFPLKLFGVAAFGGVVVLIIVVLLYKVSIYKCFLYCLTRTGTHDPSVRG